MNGPRAKLFLDAHHIMNKLPNCVYLFIIYTKTSHHGDHKRLALEYFN